MSIVVGDHISVGDKITKFVFLVDEMREGGRLIFRSDNFTDKVIIFDLEKTEGPARLELLVPKSYNKLFLEKSNRELFEADLDHRNGLSTVLIYSCDHVEADTNPSLFHRLEEEHENAKSRYGRCLHVHGGDNIYADAAWYEGLRNPENSLNAYRERYRKTWFGTETRKRVYGNDSHLMIEDDHAIVNDLVLSEEPKGREEIIRTGLDVYEEYQESLHLGKLQSSGKGWFRIFGEDLIVTFERMSEPVDMESVISTLEEIIKNYCPRGLIMVTGWPCIPSPRDTMKSRIHRRITGNGKFLEDGELIKLYTFLFSCNVDHILLVGGDLHFGFQGVMRSDQTNKSIDLVISSAISNLPDITRKLCASSYPNRMLFGDHIQIDKLSSMGMRNYLRLIIDPNDTPGGEFDSMEWMENRRRYNVNLIYSEIWLPESKIRYLRSMWRMRG
jgi:hypothetical protein